MTSNDVERAYRIGSKRKVGDRLIVAELSTFKVSFFFHLTDETLIFLKINIPYRGTLIYALT